MAINNSRLKLENVVSLSAKCLFAVSNVDILKNSFVSHLLRLFEQQNNVWSCLVRVGLYVRSTEYGIQNYFYDTAVQDV